MIYYNRSRLTPEEETGAEFVSFEEVLKRSDVLSLHCPLTKDTRHLLNKDSMAAITTPAIV